MSDQGSTPDLQSEHVPHPHVLHPNSHRNIPTTDSHHGPTVQFSFLNDEAMPAADARGSDNINGSNSGSVLQRACQVVLQGFRTNSGGNGSTGHNSGAAAVSEPQSPKKIRTKTVPAGTKTKRGGRRPDTNTNNSTTSKTKRQGGKRLSLSEYRKADESSSVRLTDADPTRCIDAQYDLTESAQCRVLGHGSSSTVRLAVRRSDHTLVAVKCLSKYEIMFSRRAGGGRESTKTSPVRHNRRLLPIGGGHRRHRRLDECEVLRALDGVPHVTHLLDVYEDDDEVQLVLEYCPGGELFDAIHRRRQLAAQDRSTKKKATTTTTASGYTEREAAVIVGQLLEALAALHERGIVHRDVKPENVFLMSTAAAATTTTTSDGNDNDLEVRLSDFGLARYLHRPHRRQPEDTTADDASSSTSTSSSSASGGESPITPQSVLRARGRAYSSVGSDFYAAPEVENGSGYDTQCDVYSLGVTLYILLGGFPRRTRAGSLDAYDAMQSVLDSPVSSSSSSEESSSDEDDDTVDSNDVPVTFPGSHWKHASSGAKDLIRKMMHSDPNVRITAKDALRHEWIAQHFKATAPATTATTAKEQPSRAPRQKKRSSLVLSAPTVASSGDDSEDRPNFRRKLSNLNLCDMSSEGTPNGTTRPSPIPDAAPTAAPMPPPMSFGKAAFSMAELYNRMSLVADTTTDKVDDADDEEIIEDEGMGGTASTPERAVTTTTTVPLSV